MATLIAVYSLLALGILLCFIGKFPGQILAYAGMLVAAFAIKNHFYPTWLLILCGVLVVASIIFNKVVAPKLANKVYEFGKAGRLGTFFGSILSILLIFALENEYVILAVFFIFPYLLAFLFELISQKNAGEAAKRAGGAYTLFAATTLVNLVICLFCAGQVIYGWVGNGPIFKGIKEVASVNREQSIQSGSSYISSVLMPGTYYYEENGPEKGSNNIVDNNTVDDKTAKQQDETAALAAEVESLRAQVESMQAQMADNNSSSSDKTRDPDYSLTYVGKIDDKYEITMNLNFSGDDVEGSYYYGSGKNCR